MCAMRGLETPICACFLGERNGVQLFTLKLPAMGFNYAPVYVYISIYLSIYLSIYIYMYVCVRVCCEVIIWAKFGLFNSYYLGQVYVIIWAQGIFDLYLLWFQVFCCSVIFFFVQLSANFKKIAFRKKGAKCFFC